MVKIKIGNNQSLFLLFIDIMLIISGIYMLFLKPQPEINPSYVAVDLVLKADNYQKQEDADPKDLVYEKAVPKIRLQIKLDESLMLKNDFIFNISNAYYVKNNQVYIKKEVMTSIINKSIQQKGNTITLTSLDYPAHEWTQIYTPLIAHALGGIRNASGKLCTYTDSYEALVENYNKGHRVFEADLSVSTDGNMLAVHYWDEFGKIMSTSEWKRYKIYGEFTTMNIDDIYQIMMVNQDMYLVLDTKSYGYDDIDVMRDQFQFLYNKAVQYDPLLLNRIIPQIYYQHMYPIIKAIYHYPSIIYTLYDSTDTFEQVIEFVSDKEDIKVITIPKQRENMIPFLRNLKTIDKIAYVHTVNDLAEMELFRSYGIDGFYTDFVIPIEFNEWFAS